MSVHLHSHLLAGEKWCLSINVPFYLLPIKQVKDYALRQNSRIFNNAMLQELNIYIFSVFVASGALARNTHYQRYAQKSFPI